MFQHITWGQQCLPSGISMGKPHEKNKMMFIKHLIHRKHSVNSNKNNGLFLKFLFKLKVGHFRVVNNSSSSLVNKQSIQFSQEIFIEHLLCGKHFSRYLVFNNKENKISDLLKLAFY